MTQITASTERHPLVDRIGRLRGRVRTVLILFGAGLLVSTAIVGFLTLVLGDYFFHFYAQTRGILLAVGALALGFMAFRRLVMPLSTKLTDQFLASRVENINKDLADELISAVHFVKSGTVTSNALAARHVEAASAKTAGLKFEDAIDFRAANKSLAVAIGLVIFTTLIAILNPATTGIVFGRFIAFDPNAAWPRTTKVEFTWGTADGKAPTVLPIGEQFTVRAKVVRGGYDGQRVFLNSYSDSQPRTVRDLMTYQKEQSGKGVFLYERAIEPVGNTSFTTWLDAGDDNDMEPVRIRLAPRPVISELSAAISPPSYVKDAADPSKPASPVIVDLLSQAGRAVEGGTVSLRIKSTKAFMVDAQGQPDVKFFDQTKDVEMTPSDETRKLLEPTVAEVTFSAKQSMQVRAQMRDSDGFENRVGGTLSLEVVPDALPSVVIVDPRRSVERSPDAMVEITGLGTDDLGLDGAKLVAEKFDAKPGDAPVFSVDLQWSDRAVDTAAGSTTGKLTYKWDLSPLKLQPGTRLSFYLMVQDNYEVKNTNPAAPLAKMFVATDQGTIRHEWVKSAPLSLQIRSEAEIAEKNRKDLNEIKERIINLKKQQEETKAKTDAINKAIKDSNVSTPQQQQQLSDLAQQQSQQAASANAIQQRTEQIKQDLEQNKMAQTDLGKLAKDVSAGMKDVGQNNMPKAASDLSKAQETAGSTKPDAKPDSKSEAAQKDAAQQTAKSTESAGAQQQEAITKMDNLINQLGTAGDFEAARAKLKDIKERQEKLAKETREAMAQTVGKNKDELTKEQKDKLENLAGQQKDLANQTADLTAQMEKAAQQMQQSDPASSESLSKAAQASHSNDVSPSQASASKSMSDNQSQPASNSQQQAQTGLQKMMDELDKQDKRKLEQLSRQLADLLRELKTRLAEETQINKETITLGVKGEKKAFLTLGDQQGRTHQNTIVNQKKAENTQDAQKAAASIREAADSMGTAAGALYGAKQPDALDPETAAMASLEEAIKLLQKQKDDTDNKLDEKTLAEFIKQYEEIKKGQEGVKGSSDVVETKRLAAEDKTIDRMGGLELNRLADVQKGLKELVNKLSNDDKLKEYDVIVWMNGQITDYMEQSRDRMVKQQTGKQLANAQQTAIDRLADIIEALKEEKDKKEQFAKDPSGGGGGGGGKSPLVPPVALLKLLKAMQMNVNHQTTSVNKDIQNAATPDEKSELQGETVRLGKQQGDIKGMAVKIMESMSPPK